MPTGYTANVHDGKDETLREFLEHLARGMGAYIMQRDENQNEPPKKREVGDYYYTAVEDAKNELNRVSYMTDRDVKAEFEKDRQEAKRYNAERLVKDKEMRERYDKVHNAVLDLDWPITEKGEVGDFFRGYRKFVLSQITESIQFDCPEDKEPYQMPVPDDVDEWYRNKMLTASKHLQYAIEGLQKQEEIVKVQNLIHDRLMDFLDNIE